MFCGISSGSVKNRGLRTINLNDLIGEDSDWVLDIAYDINNLGQIVGKGTFNGESRAYLLNPVSAPVPEPATMLLLCTGLAGLAGFKKRLRNPNPILTCSFGLK